MTVTTERLTEIAMEVMDLMGAPTIFGLLDDKVGDFAAVEARLQEVMQSRLSFDTMELAMYLRTANTRRNNLPTWQPLLNAAYEMGRMRGERVDDIFFGLMPPTPHPGGG